MKRVLLTIEHGGNYGHAAMVSVLASILKDEGYEVTVAAPSRELALRLFHGASYRLVEGPECRGRGAARPELNWDSAATVMWDSPLSLPQVARPLFDAWRRIYDTVKPDVALFNFSPFATIAAHGYGMRRIQVGTPYEVLPATTPLPSIRYWTQIPREEALAFEQRLLARILEGLGLSAQAITFDALIQPDAALVTGVKELDPYHAWPRQYVGPVPLPQSGKKLEWERPAEGKGGRKALAYLYARSIDVASVSRQLAALFGESVIVCPDADDALMTACAGKGVRLQREFADISALVHTCDLMVTHASSIVLQAVVRGVPQAVFPTQFEQFLSARRLSDCGLAAMANPQETQACLAAIRLAAESPKLRAETKSAGRRYADFVREPEKRLAAALRTLIG